MRSTDTDCLFLSFLFDFNRETETLLRDAQIYSVARTMMRYHLYCKYIIYEQNQLNIDQERIVIFQNIGPDRKLYTISVNGF